MAGISGDGNIIKCNSFNVAAVKIDITHSDKKQQQTFPKEPIKFNVRDPVKSFTGRDDELKDIHNKLQSEKGQVVVSQIASISGLGGIGKSELARKYACDYKKDFDDNVIWINAETQESLKQSYQELAKELRIPITEKRDEKEQERNIKSIVKDVYKYFQNAKSLFIFDNAEEYGDVNEFLPSPFFLYLNGKKPHVLITSRNRDWEVGEEGKIEVVQLGELTPEKAAEFIRKALELEDKKNDLQETEILQLAKELQYFPLALRQAISYIKENNIKLKIQGKTFKISDYLKVYEKEAKKLLDFESRCESDRYAKTTFITWKVTIENIKHKEYGQVALNVLNIMAYLAPDKVPVERLFLKLVEEKKELWDAVYLLNQYSMINVEQGLSNIHRLVQQVIRLGLQNQSKEKRILGKALEIINSSDVAELEENHSHVISIWEYASKYGELIDHYYFNSFCGYIKYTPLHLLAKNNRYKTIKAILIHIEKYHSNKLTKIVNAPNYFGETPLQLAAESGSFNVVKYLIEEKGADFNAPDNEGKTSLHWAAEHNRLNVVKYLIEEKGADFNASDDLGYTSLHFAAVNGSFDVVKYLIEEKGADFNALDNEGKTSLHLAAIHGSLDVVKYLIEEKGADFNAPDNQGRTPLNLAAVDNRLDVVKYLIEEKGTDFNASDNQGKTPLHWAAVGLEGLDVVKYLIEEKGADFNVIDSKGKTPLHLAAAARFGSLDVVKYLIEKGADFNAPDNEGKTLLHWAAVHGSLDVVKYLIEEKCTDFNALDNQGKTSLHWAAVQNKGLDVVKYLIEEKGADFNAPDNEGKTPLHSAAAALFGSLDVVKYLIEKKGADFNAPDNEGKTTLHSAATRFGSLDVVKYLIEEKGTDFNAPDNEGKTPLHLAAAARFGSLDVVKYLIEEKGADFNAPDNEGKTPLHLAAAARFGSLDVVKYLIEKGADFNALDNQGQTPLHYLDQFGRLDLVKYLMNEKSADFKGNSPGNQGKTSFTLSRCSIL